MCRNMHCSNLTSVAAAFPPKKSLVPLGHNWQGEVWAQNHLEMTAKTKMCLPAGHSSRDLLQQFIAILPFIHSIDTTRPSKQNMLYLWHRCFPHLSELFDVSDLLKPENEKFFFLHALQVFKGTACIVPSQVSLVCPSVNSSYEDDDTRASLVGFYWQGKMKGLGGKPLQLVFYPPQINTNWPGLKLGPLR